MTLLKGLGTGLCLTVLCVLAAPKAKADDWNRRTVITFSEPVEVPGSGAQVLPAGTYVFKVTDSLSDRHIVQIFNQDETHVFTTILAIPRDRFKVTDETVITFRERPAGEPEALRTWYFPGRKTGDEFVYDRPKALLLAKETNETILSTPAVLAAAPIDVLKAAPLEAVTPAGETVDVAQVVSPPAAAEAAPAPVLVASLPKTASNLGSIGLAGMMLLCGGLLLSGFAKKRM
ncbi:MAG: hypothetical protein ABR907_08970 [Terracidiphilus sp.]|jgi:hypothetical protein